LFHLTGVAKENRFDRIGLDRGLHGRNPAITQRPSPRWVGALGMAMAEIVVGRAVERMQRIEPDLATAVL